MDNFFVFARKVYLKLPVLLLDIFTIPIAWFLAYALRYNLYLFSIPVQSPNFSRQVVILITIQVACFYYFKVYRGIWRFFSLSDVNRILRSTVVATVLLIPVYYSLSILSDVPRSAFPLYCLVISTLLCGTRVLRRHYWDNANKQQEHSLSKRVLIIGAGQAGESLIRDLRRLNLYVPVGLVDDNSIKKGLEVHGVRVLGHTDLLTAFVRDFKVDLIFIAIPSASSSAMRLLVEKCERCQIPFRTLPSIHALASGRVEVDALRDVHIEDLLGRDQVELQWEKISSEVHNKRILVTGGGGSIGSELCRQIMFLQPSKLLVMDNSEYNLYSIDVELRNAFPDLSLELALVSVTDAVAVNHHVRRFKPEIVFHAAAFKHVPMLEPQIRAAVMNNVIGTQVIAEACVAVGVEKFILISTDKAVNPTNVMGTTKRIAEIYCQNLNARVRTRFITVRFGNVLGSVGSVVPLFKKQLKQGGPLTVTHPDMERYFMTIPEASQLILQAMANGNGGEIFVLDMGAPIKISYLAEQIIRLAGKEPGKDIKIQYTGLRPGEKLFEELFHSSEQLIKTEHEKLFKARVREMSWNELMEAIHLMKTACSANLSEELWVLLKNLVPEFKCDLVEMM